MADELDASPAERAKPGKAGRTPASEQLKRVGAKMLFDKTLTSSDTGGQGRILIPKVRPSMLQRQLHPWLHYLGECEQVAAAEHLPAVDSQTGVSIPFIDTLGNSYTLKFRFWANGQGRIFILEGTQPIQAGLRTLGPAALLQLHD